MLDNLDWHALTGPHAEFALVHGEARRYRDDTARYSALPDSPGPGAWRDLAALSGPGAEVVLRGAPATPPPGWSVARTGRAVQLVATAAVHDEPDDEAVTLGAEDVPEIFDLIGRTKPGPWRSATIELGHYLGIRRGGRLVAMAGERVHAPGWTEVSAVCTDEAHRGQGLATRLVHAVVHTIRSRGEEALLHAAATNTPAIRLYEELGFAVRDDVVLKVLITP